MNPSQSIVGDTIRLGPLDVGAVERGYFDWMHDDAVIANLEVRFADRSRDALRSFIERTNAARDMALFGIFAVPDDQYIGNLKLTEVRPHRRVEIGLLIGPVEARGKGYGTAAIRLAADYAFAHLGAVKVTAGCYATNRASIRAFERVGFHIEAVRPSHYDTADGRVDGVYLALSRGDPKAGAAAQSVR